MKRKVCCDHFEAALASNCPDHPDPDAECADVCIIKVKRGYGLPIKDGGSSYLVIRFCPFCGNKLPRR